MRLQKRLSDQHPAEPLSRLNQPVIADLGREAAEEAGFLSSGWLVSSANESETQHSVRVTAGERLLFVCS